MALIRDLRGPATESHCDESISATVARIAEAAEEALRCELRAYPKPGLVSYIDAGAHDDMDHHTMQASIAALGPHFEKMAHAGAVSASFAGALQPLGIEAERAMLAATAGINTHRGAIFCLGLLSASAGLCSANDQACSTELLQSTLLDEWGESLKNHQRSRVGADSHGAVVAQHYGAGGASAEAAQGFPTVFGVGVPALRRAQRAGLDSNAAHIQTLFALMAVVPDSNVLHRGGTTAAGMVRLRARQFLDGGGCHVADWRDHATKIHEEFIDGRLSPGGCADLLAATMFVTAIGDLR